MTVKELRRMMRNSKKDGHFLGEIILVEGAGQIQKIGNRYAVGPVPELDDSDPLTDYSAWTYGLRESWVLNFFKPWLDEE